MHRYLFKHYKKKYNEHSGKVQQNMDDIIDAHYFMLPTQGNIYSLTILKLYSGVKKLLVASLKKKVFLFEYCESSEGILKPTVKEVSCTYIPSGAEIISIDAYNKSKTCDDFQIGIAIAKLNTEGSHETYLNIYSEQDLHTSYVLNIDSIAQNCLMVELNFIPYQLNHIFILNESCEPKETVWLLSGSDCKIHVYQEDQQNHSYSEADISELFPELANLPSITTWFDIQYTYNFTRRVTAVGCECGTLQLSVVNTKTNTVLFNYTEIYDGPISQVFLFSRFPKDIFPPHCVPTKGKEGEVELDDALIVDHEDGTEENSNPNVPKNDIHLLVCNTLEASVVYMNIEETGFSGKHKLEGSERYDACLCACTADINMDGYNEILLGTYGQKVFLYKWNDTRWELSGLLSTGNPIYGLQYVDLIGDGVNELVVQTLSGVHIMQHDPEKVCQLMLTRMRRLLGKEEEVHSAVVIEEEAVLEAEDCPCEEACEQLAQ